MKHLGDITKIHGAAVEPVEVIIGGSPCQDLSVAGKRAGLAGERSGLFMEQIRIIKEMRSQDEKYGAVNPRPRYMVWENVPGAFSSNGGEDFRAVLEETARIVDCRAVIPRPQCGWTNSGAVVGEGWSIAWRVHDAQLWGVPQRRRRIALVADFGGYTAPEILFERNGLSRNTPPSSTPWKDFAAAIENRFRGSNSAERTIGGPDPYQPTYCIQGNCVDRPDTAACNGKGWCEDKSYTLNTVDRPAVCNISGNDIAGVLDASYHKGVGSRSGNEREVVAIVRAAFNQGINAQYDMEISESGINSALTSRGPSAVCAGFKAKMGAKAHGIGYESDTAPTLSSEQHDAAVCMATQQGGAEIRTDDKAPTLTAAAGMSGNNQPVYCAFHGQASSCAGISVSNDVSPTIQTAKQVNVKDEYNVRRLTPLECERLQGFPDGWTDIGDWIDSNGKKHKNSDSPRYKALGNSIALPPWAWILDRLNFYCTIHTMASLFDGIGGFPLIWETLNGKGSCLWASEIEEFPIAVTKYHFGG